MEVLVAVRAPNVTIERIAIVHVTPAGARPTCLGVGPREFRLRSVLLAMQGRANCMRNSEDVANIHVDDCVLIGNIECQGHGSFVNCLLASNSLHLGGTGSKVDLRLTTFLGKAQLALTEGPSTLFDSVVGSVHWSPPNSKHRIDRCFFCIRFTPHKMRFVKRIRTSEKSSIEGCGESGLRIAVSSKRKGSHPWMQTLV